MASSRARTLDSRPTTNGVIMYGKMTTSRMGIIGKRFVSDFSLEVSMFLRLGNNLEPDSAGSGQALAGLFQYGKVDFLRQHHLLGDLEFPDLFVRRQIVHQI